MSTPTAAKTKFEFLVILPDQEGALERRLKVRPYVFLPCSWVEQMGNVARAGIYGLMREGTYRTHFANLKTGFESGLWVMGG